MWLIRAANSKARTVDELAETMTGPELAELRAYDRIAPLDAAERVEVAVGLAALSRYTGDRDLTGRDFMADWERPYREPKPQPDLATLKATLLTAFGITSPVGTA